MSSTIIASLQIDRAELITALAALRKFLRRKKGIQAALTFDGGLFYIEAGGMSVMASASGEWRGQARVQSSLLIAYAGQLPPGDPLMVKVADSYFHLGSCRISCLWTAAEDDWVPRPTIRLPMDATLMQILTLRLHHSAEEIRQSALETQVGAAVKERDERLGRAARALEPLGVTWGDLEWLVEHALKRAE